MPSLRVLDLAGNYGIQGAIPECFFNPRYGLLSLGLYNCNLDGNLETLPNVRHLDLGNNGFKGKFPGYVAKDGSQDRLLTLDVRNNE